MMYREDLDKRAASGCEAPGCNHANHSQNPLFFHQKCCNPRHLFLGTQRDNQQDCVTRGRRPNRKGSRHPLAKLSEQDVIAIRNSAGPGAVLAAKFSVAESTICQIRKGSTWRHV